MPVSYPSGTLAEHLACREKAVIFDVSHLGTVRVQGERAFDLLQNSLTNDLSKISPGRTQYTHLLNDSAGVMDDIIIWWIEDEIFDVMPNASNTDGVLGALGEGRDVTSQRAVLALQGPDARRLLRTIDLAASEVSRRRVEVMRINDVPCTVAGTGYTGEDGVEIAVPSQDAPALWNGLIDAGFLPAGLGARDTLRLEAGLPLHGHELAPTINPLEAGLGWVVGWNKPSFIGRDALMRIRTEGSHRKLVGIATEGRRPPRDGSDVLIQGKPAGIVTSGNFSPCLEHGIAMAFVDATVNILGECTVDVRGTQISGRFVPLPFVPHRG